MKTRDFWTGMEEFIFFTNHDMGWQEGWDVLMFEGIPVRNMKVAIELVRRYMNRQAVGLATFDQMSVNNAQWDNL